MNNKLETMMLMQKTLQEFLGYDFEYMTPKERTAFIKEMSIHVNQELNEMLYELPFFKPWKDYSNMTDEQIEEGFMMARKELIDFVHFFLNIAIALKMSPEDVFNEYHSKNAENYKRQVEGYTHDKKFR